MLDGRFDPAFHQAFVSSAKDPVEFPLSGPVLAMLGAAIAVALSVLCLLVLP